MTFVISASPLGQSAKENESDVDSLPWGRYRSMGREILFWLRQGLPEEAAQVEMEVQLQVLVPLQRLPEPELLPEQPPLLGLGKHRFQWPVLHVRLPVLPM